MAALQVVVGVLGVVVTAKEAFGGLPAWAVIGTVAAVAAVLAATRSALGIRSWLGVCLWVAAAIGAIVTIVLLAISLLGAHSDSSPPTGGVPDIMSPALHLPQLPVIAPVITERAPGAAKHLVVEHDEPWWWGGRSLARTDGSVSTTVPNVIVDVVACYDALLVVDVLGHARLINPLTGQQVGMAKGIGSGAAHPVCGFDSAFFAMPAQRGRLAYIYRGRSTDLAPQARIKLYPPPGSVRAPRHPRALKVAISSLLVSVDGSGHVARIDVGRKRNQIQRYLPAIVHPGAISGYAAGALVIERDSGCIRRVAGTSGNADGGGVHAPGSVLAVAHREDEELVLGKDGTLLRRLEDFKLHALGPSIPLPAGVKLTDLVATKDGWLGLDAQDHEFVPLPHALVVLLEDARRRAGAKTPRLLRCW